MYSQTIKGLSKDDITTLNNFIYNVNSGIVITWEDTMLAISIIEKSITVGLNTVVALSTKSVCIRTGTIEGCLIKYAFTESILDEETYHTNVWQKVVNFNNDKDKLNNTIECVCLFIEWLKVNLN